MTRDALIEAARSLLDAATAEELAEVYSEHMVFPNSRRARRDGVAGRGGVDRGALRRRVRNAGLLNWLFD